MADNNKQEFGAFAKVTDKEPFATTRATTIEEAAKALDRLVWAYSIENPVIRPIGAQA